MGTILFFRLESRTQTERRGSKDNKQEEAEVVDKVRVKAVEREEEKENQIQQD